MNSYRLILQNNLPRLINCFNLDGFSNSFGNADRQYWGWKTTDFPNATMQGGIHALAIAYALGLYGDEKMLNQIFEGCVQAVDKAKSRSGGLAEAYPNENSFCVTALVAFDLISAIKILENRLPDFEYRRHLPIIEGLIQFITKNDEEHAIISNHLATGAAAIALWNDLTGFKSTRDQELLEVIFQHQSAEGWYQEYEGPDPGYQTLCLYYLHAAQRVLKSSELQESIDRSLDFLKYFIHPDGSIGGLYGSRNTEVFYPGGLAGLSTDSKSARAMLSRSQTAFTNGRHIMPADIDMGNFVPLLNSYAYAAVEMQNQVMDPESDPLPADQEFEKEFPEAGIFVKSNQKYYGIVNYKKGGTLKVFDKLSGEPAVEDGGLIGELADGTKFSTQSWNDDYTFADHTISARFYRVNEEYPTPFTLVLVRFLAMTVFNNRFLGNSFKKAIVKRLMTGKRPFDGQAQRKFVFDSTVINVEQVVHPPKGCRKVIQGGKFRAIHMASSGYNLPGTHSDGKGGLLEFKIIK